MHNCTSIDISQCSIILNKVQKKIINTYYFLVISIYFYTFFFTIVHFVFEESNTILCHDLSQIYVYRNIYTYTTS